MKEQKYLLSEETLRRIDWLAVLLLILLLLALKACRINEQETTIRVQGMVMAAADSTPIVGATVGLYKISGWVSNLIVQKKTDNQGRYSLTYVEKGYFGETLFSIMASASGFKNCRYISSDSVHICYTEELQTINFLLVRSP